MSTHMRVTRIYQHDPLEAFCIEQVVRPLWQMDLEALEIGREHNLAAEARGVPPVECQIEH
eukprot:scaffold3274_cov125-Isochrysis_galbana.AAC.2